MPNRTKDQKRAEYYLFSWQIRAIQQLARQQATTPSAVVRRLLSEVIAAPQAIEASSQKQSIKPEWPIISSEPSTEWIPPLEDK